MEGLDIIMFYILYAQQTKSIDIRFITQQLYIYVHVHDMHTLDSNNII